MSSFVFHIDFGQGPAHESFDVELESLSAARAEAIVFLGEMLRERPSDFSDGEGSTVTVEDHCGLVLFRIEVASTASPAVVYRFAS